MPATEQQPGAATGTLDARRREALLQAGALQNAILHSASFSTLTSKCGFATLLVPHGGRPALAGLGALITDESGVIRIFNVGAERMLGHAAADVLNRLTPGDLSDPQGLAARAAALSLEFGVPIAPGIEALVFKAARGIEDIHELTYIRRDGSRLAALVSVAALRDAAGGIIGYLHMGTDNTERKRLDQVLHDTHQALQNAKFEAERANLAKSDFLSHMSHELRSPLNAILGFTQLIDSGAPPPTPGQKASIDQILRAGWYLLELINEILDLALIESGKMSLSHEPMSLADVLGDCRAMIEPQASKRGIRVVFPCFDGAVFVKADQTRVKQVFINLLSNAIKYNRDGGQVEVTCSAGGTQRLRISVRDTGLGLPPQDLARLFQPFNRLGQQSGVEEGTGIGLVVSKRLVELMGGRIGVESTVGVGSVFWIELHAALAPHAVDDELAPSVAVPPQVLADAPRRTLLCVEDNPANLMLVERLLARRTDIRLLSARDGESGIQIARAERPDVILMDINLPGISGLDALRILAGDPAMACIPVIALSANAMPHDVQRGLAAGFFRYLTKPIRLQQFMDTLDDALALARATPAAARTEGGAG